MRWYSDFPGQRSRQITADVIAGIGIIVAIVCGVVVGSLIAALGEIGRVVANAGGGVRDSMLGLQADLLEIPLIGEQIAAPFAGAGDAGSSMVAAGESFQQTVLVIAVLAGLGLALAPIAVIALLWLVPRVRRMQRAAQLRSLVRPDGAIVVEGFIDLELQKAGVRR